MSGSADGAAADAIRAAETALAKQKSLTAQVDLQVVTAVLNAHAAHAVGAAALDGLQEEIEAAVVTRTDLDSPAGAREFQRYLIDKLRDIRTVVETADLDATSKAALAAALASLYASSSPPESSPPELSPSPTNGTDRPEPHPERTPPQDASLPSDIGIPWDPGLDPPPVGEQIGAAPIDVAADSPPSTPAAVAPPPVAPPPVAPTPAAAMTAPAAGWGGGGYPAATIPSGGSLPTLPASSLPDFSTHTGDESPHRGAESKADPEPPDTGDQKPGGTEPGSGEWRPADDLTIALPDGHTVTATSPQLAAVISAAVAGTQDAGIAPCPAKPGSLRQRPFQQRFGINADFGFESPPRCLLKPA